MAWVSTRGGRLSGRWVAVACVCVGWVCTGPLTAEDRSATGPADADAATEIEIAANVDEALAFSEAEQADLSDVVDGDGVLPHPGLYVLLRRAAGLPAEDQLLAYAQPVAGMDLLANPAAYRGGLVDLHIRIWRVSRWTDPTDTATRGWGLRPVWRLDCEDRATGEPVIVLLTELPDRLAPGELSPAADDSVLGLFYKVVRLPVERPAEAATATKLYPVLVAKTLYGAQGRRSRIGEVILAIFVVVLVVGYVLVKRSARNTPPPSAASAAAGTDAPVDEDLVRAVEDHEQQNSEGENA